MRSTRRAVTAFSAVLVVALAITRPAFAQSDAQSGRLIANALTAMGGEAALRALAGTRSTIWLTRFAPGQGQWTDAPLAPRHLVGVETRDFARGATDIRGERRTAGATAPFRILSTPSTGYEQIFTYVVRYDADSLAVRAKELALSPARVLLTAREADCRHAAARDARPDGRTLLELSCTHATAGAFKLRLDSATAWPIEVERDHPSRVNGIERTVTTYSGFQRVASPSGDLVLPHVARVTIAGRLTTLANYERIEALAEQPPDSLFTLSPAAARPMRVTVRELAPGVIYLGSDSLYFSLAVMRGSSAILIDPPEMETRLRSMLDSLRGRVPNATVDNVVVTHHHEDHLAALPLLFDHGATAIASAANAPRVRSIAAVAMARRPANDRRPRVVRPLRDSLVIAEGTPNEVRVYAVAIGEAATHLFAYLPRHRLLFVADAAEGGRFQDIRPVVQRLGLAVDWVALSHSGVYRWQ